MTLASPDPATVAASQPRRLLLVDDESNILAALKRTLRRDGYTIFTATSGPQALELLTAEPVGVILSDQRMPGMTGVELLRRVKSLYPDTVRITLSGFTELQSIIDAVNEGAVYKFLTKPWDDELLRGHVAEAFAQRGMADDNRRLLAEVASGHAELARLNQRLTELLRQAEHEARVAAAGAMTVQEMIDAMPIAVLAIDPEGLLVQANPAAMAWLPHLASAAGQSAGPPLLALLAQLRQRRPAAACGQPADIAAQTAPHPVSIGGRPSLAWHVRLEGAESGRGELLMLASATAPAPDGAAGAWTASTTGSPAWST